MPRRTEEVEPKSSREEMDGELGEGWLVAMWAWIDAGESIVSSLPSFLLFLSFSSVPFLDSFYSFHFRHFFFTPSIHPSFSGVKPHRYVCMRCAVRVDQTKCIQNVRVRLLAPLLRSSSARSQFAVLLIPFIRWSAW